MRIVVNFAREALLQPPFVHKPVNFAREAIGAAASKRQRNINAPVDLALTFAA